MLGNGADKPALDRCSSMFSHHEKVSAVFYCGIAYFLLDVAGEKSRLSLDSRIQCHLPQPFQFQLCAFLESGHDLARVDIRLVRARQDRKEHMHDMQPRIVSDGEADGIVQGPRGGGGKIDRTENGLYVHPGL